MNKKSAICVLTLVAALALVCEAGPFSFGGGSRKKNIDPLEELNKIMERANDFDGHSLIFAWENHYKNSKPLSESDKLAKLVIQKFVKFFQFDTDSGCSEEDANALNDTRRIVAKYDLLSNQRKHENLMAAFWSKETRYALACGGLMPAHWTV